MNLHNPERKLHNNSMYIGTTYRFDLIAPISYPRFFNTPPEPVTGDF